MSRAVPGVAARDDLRRERIRDQRLSAWVSGRHPKQRPKFVGLGFYFHLHGHRSFYRCSFTLQSSGIGVEQGRLGEVVSLVGDCRPPPPGNPRRPAFSIGVGNRWGLKDQGSGGAIFSREISKNGEIELLCSNKPSLYEYRCKANLKELNKSQYFKKNRSSFYCTGMNPVLKFDRLHSHLCGSLEVKPPPIAITNVLRIG